MKIVNYVYDHVPTWALSYLVNNDATGLTDTEKRDVDRWYMHCRQALHKYNRRAVVGFVYGDHQPSFTHNPAFGLACDTIPGAVIALVPHDEPGDPIPLPWMPFDQEEAA